MRQSRQRAQLRHLRTSRWGRKWFDYYFLSRSDWIWRGGHNSHMQKFMIPMESGSMLEMELGKIDDVKTAAGVTATIFEAFYLPMLKAFAEHVQRLPLSRTVFRDDCGAFQFGLVASMVALRVASTQMFFPETLSEDRRVLEPQCRFAAFAATLATAVALVAQNAAVSSADGHAEYHALVSPVTLAKWLAINPGSTLEWRVAGNTLSAPECAAIAARFIPIGLLNNFDLRVSLMMFGSISPQLTANGVESTLSRVVRQSVAKVLEHYQAQDERRYQESASSPPSGLSAANDIANSLTQKTMAPNPVSPAVQAGGAAAGPDAGSSQPPIGGTGAAPPSGATESELLSKAHPALRDWLSAVSKHEKFKAFHANLNFTDEGIEVPITMLSHFGVSAAKVRQMLTDADMVVGRTSDSRGIVLAPALKPFFSGTE